MIPKNMTTFWKQTSVGLISVYCMYFYLFFRIAANKNLIMEKTKT